MDVDDVIRKAGRRFGDSNNVLILAADFFDFINDGQLQIVRLTGDIKTTNTGAAASTYPLTLPATFIRGERMEYDGNPLKLITKRDLDDLNVDVADYPDKPNFYYYYNNQVHLYPDPPVGDTTSVSFIYWSMPTSVTGTGQNLTVPIAHHEDLVTFVVARCHERNENWAMYQQLMNEFNAGLGQRIEEAKVKNDTYPIIQDDYWDSWYQ